MNTFRRARSPASYWLSIAAALFTAAIGIGFVYIGVRMAEALQ